MTRWRYNQAEVVRRYVSVTSVSADDMSRLS
jgi:hypothetical protein